MKIILLNGPPGAGKDTIANLCQAMLGGKVAIEKFAKPIKDAACGLYCGGNRALFDKMDSYGMKEIPSEIFLGKTCREVQQAISEQFVKLYHGQGAFGQMMVNRIAVMPSVDYIVVSDSGFASEAKELINVFGTGSVKLVRLSRAGHHYGTDTRDYINLDSEGIATIEVFNEEDNAGNAVRQIKKFVEEQ